MEGPFAARSAERDSPPSRTAAASGTGTFSVPWIGALALVLIGAVGLASPLKHAWSVWTSDPLRSFGMLLPVAALGIGVRRFRRSDWQGTGSWWGFAAMVLAVVVATLSYDDRTQLWMSVGSLFYTLKLAPDGVLVAGYFAGAVLLFGGRKALRHHGFSLGLLLLINPVPHLFSTVLDLPLQTLGAQVARWFAQSIGVPVNGDALKLMFAPQLGMFVAPGCDGLRGAAVMGYLALIVGYLHRLRRPTWALFVIGALLLAYAFNLLRLCVVIGYYWLALRLPAIGSYGTEVDYAIGGCLFLTAAALLFRVPATLGRR